MTSTDTGSALLRAVCDEPEDMTHRLVYADWLDEQGQSERAELIRLQVDTSRSDVRQWAWRVTRCLILLTRHQSAWRDDPCPGLSWDSNWSGDFRRGFVESISLPLTDFLRHAHTLFAHHPITEVALTDRQPVQTECGDEEPHAQWWRMSLYRSTRGLRIRRPHVLSQKIFDLLPGKPWQTITGGIFLDYPTVTDAHVALSRACVAWGRQQAGLPSLPAK